MKSVRIVQYLAFDAARWLEDKYALQLQQQQCKKMSQLCRFNWTVSRRSIQKHTFALHMSVTSVHRILHWSLHMHPYKIIVVKELSERDYETRTNLSWDITEMKWHFKTFQKIYEFSLSLYLFVFDKILKSGHIIFGTPCCMRIFL